jgi:hypothetical protein
VNKIKDLLDGMNFRPSATDSAIAAGKRELGVDLPPEYREFLKRANGGEGFVGKNYLILWRVEELASMNQAYQIQEYIPGLLIFGSSGGGEAYGFDTRTPNWTIVRVPFVGMEWSLAEPMGATFNGFLERLSEID